MTGSAGALRDRGSLGDVADLHGTPGSATVAPMLLLAACLACNSDPAPPAPLAPPAPVVDAPADPPPAGRIGGSPILPDPVVLGAIDPEAVDRVVEAQGAAIARCYEAGLAETPGLSGKVLVKLAIAADGTVSRVSTKSTSLRNTAVEECLEARLARARFPALESGEVALVTYPFVFPPGR